MYSELHEVMKANLINRESAISSQTKNGMGIQRKLKLPKELKELQATMKTNRGWINYKQLHFFFFLNEEPWALFVGLHLAKF